MYPNLEEKGLSCWVATPCDPLRIRIRCLVEFEFVRTAFEYESRRDRGCVLMGNTADKKYRVNVPLNRHQTISCRGKTRKCPSVLLTVLWKLGYYPLNVDTRQNPRRHVVFIKIQPNAYHKYLPQTEGSPSILWGGFFLYI